LSKNVLSLPSRLHLASNPLVVICPVPMPNGAPKLPLYPKPMDRSGTLVGFGGYRTLADRGHMTPLESSSLSPGFNPDEIVPLLREIHSAGGANGRQRRKGDKLKQFPATRNTFLCSTLPMAGCS
jgi:hypothetical protein